MGQYQTVAPGDEALAGSGIVPTAKELADIERLAPESFVFGTDGRPVVVVTRGNTDSSVREEYVAANIKRPLPRFLDRGDLFPHRRCDPIAIVAGGPSVKRHLDEIRKFRWVMTAGNAHDFVTTNGIKPSFAVAVDCNEDTQDYFRYPVKGCSYLLASIVSPTLFEALKGQDIQLWHFLGQVDPVHYRGERAIGWGCMVSIPCIQLALFLGFQEQHYFGYDCSLEENTHAYPVSGEEDKGILARETKVSMGDGEDKVEFRTTDALISCMNNFYQVYKGPDGQYMKGYVHGGGLLWENIKRSPPEMKRWLEAV